MSPSILYLIFVISITDLGSFVVSAHRHTGSGSHYFLRQNSIFAHNSPLKSAPSHKVGDAVSRHLGDLSRGRVVTVLHKGFAATPQPLLRDKRYSSALIEVLTQCAQNFSVASHDHLNYSQPDQEALIQMPQLIRSSRHLESSRVVSNRSQVNSVMIRKTIHLTLDCLSAIISTFQRQGQTSGVSQLVTQMLNQWLLAHNVTPLTAEASAIASQLPSYSLLTKHHNFQSDLAGERLLESASGPADLRRAEGSNGLKVVLVGVIVFVLIVVILFVLVNRNGKPKWSVVFEFCRFTSSKDDDQPSSNDKPTPEYALAGFNEPNTVQAAPSTVHAKQTAKKPTASGPRGYITAPPSRKAAAKHKSSKRRHDGSQATTRRQSAGVQYRSVSSTGDSSCDARAVTVLCSSSSDMAVCGGQLSDSGSTALSNGTLTAMETTARALLTQHRDHSCITPSSSQGSLSR